MIRFVLAAGLAVLSGGAMAADARVLVPMPDASAQILLGDMRDHLTALDEILGALAEGSADVAATVAETRLGVDSTPRRHAEAIGPHMPPTMREMALALHNSASRLAVAIRESQRLGADEGQRRVFGALRELSGTCSACHHAYRVR
ncbi:MAG: hypothetical protein HQL40_09255 [Alphaproteobacteria bacterium]|nr:hypothetical protein [Alphaproteobacteria bacterium]